MKDIIYIEKQNPEGHQILQCTGWFVKIEKNLELQFSPKTNINEDVAVILKIND